MLSGDPSTTAAIGEILPQATLGAYLASRAIGNAPNLAENFLKTAQWIETNARFGARAVYEALRVFTPQFIWPDRSGGKMGYTIRGLADFALPAAINFAVVPSTPEAVQQMPELMLGAYLLSRIGQRCFSAAQNMNH